MKDVFRLIIVHTLDHFWAHQRAFGDDSFKRNHVVQVGRTKRSGIARIFAKASDESTVVVLHQFSHVVI